MPYYMIQASYNPQAMAAMIQSPQDRPKILRSIIDKLGGSLEGFWMAFGEYDVVIIGQLPNDTSAAAVSMAVSAAGAVKEIKTTILLPWDEAMLAMQQAANVGYVPPKSTR
jgi:uncharacterized protein with GYD domain